MPKRQKFPHLQGALPMFPRPPIRSWHVWLAGAATFFAAIGQIGPSPLNAQGWDPFSQLETDDWQRRPASQRRKEPPQPPRESERDAGAFEPTAAQAIAPPSSIEMEPMAPIPGAESPGERAAPPAYSTGNSPQRATYPPATGPQGGDSARYPAPSGSGPGHGLQDGRYAVRRFPDEPLPNGTSSPAGSSNWNVPAAEPVSPFPPPSDGNAAGSIPYDLWRGVDAADLESMMASPSIPPRSLALHDLWRRLLVSNAPPGTGGQTSEHFQALRLEALYRSGMLSDMREILAQGPRRGGNQSTPLIAMLRARIDIGLGDREAGCAAVKNLTNIRTDIPKSLRGAAILVSGYCAATTGNSAAAGLLAELAREEGVKPSPGLAALDAVALGVATDVSLKDGQQLSLIDYRILALAEAAPPPDQLVKVATPALLVALASDKATTSGLRLEAAEAAARINAITPDDLAGIYRQTATAMGADAQAVEASAGGQETANRRALLFAAADAERTPFKKVRQIRAFLDSAHRANLYLPALAIAGKLTAEVGLVPEIGWFAETAIEANLVSGDYERARMWTKFAATLDNGSGSNLDHWLALIDIADPHFPGTRGASLAALESMALRGRFSSDSLHRLATVLDALEYNVPIPLWEAASRTPQPSSGHLPETGILSELQDAAKKREFGRTVLLAVRTLGPDGADAAHIIALGDSIRALKRAGMETDARRLGFEALVSGWPRMVVQ